MRRENQTYTREQIEAIHNGLPYGEKVNVAKQLGIKTPALSRYINLRGFYTKDSNKRQYGYKMPADVYNKIIEIIKNKATDENAKTIN